MNFQDLLQKMKTIDEGTDMSGDIITDVAAEECGMGMSPMMPPMMSPQSPPQQDTVSMNVSMNAQGKGGIRDLMNVLKDIQDGAGSDSDVISTQPHGIEIDADPEADIAMPQHSEPEFDDADDEIEIVHTNKEENEEYSNTPEPAYQSQDYMHNTLSGNSQKMNKGNSPNADNVLTMAAILPVAAGMVREDLKSRLLDHYNSIKEGVAGPKKCWPGHRKTGTQPGTGKNAGKRVNNCEKIKEDTVDKED